MKKTFALIGFLATLAISASAQLRTTTRSTINQGNYLDFPGNWYAGSGNTVPGSTLADTLQVSDTVAYIIPINHTNDVDFFDQVYWIKSGSGTATVTATFYQSNDPYNFTTGSQLTSGVAKSNYSKTLTLSATGWSYISFKQDSVNFEGRYLKVQYMTSSTASVGGKIFSRLKSTIK